MKQYCDKFFTFILFCLIFFTGCSSLKYEKIIKQVSSYNWYQNMDDANKSLQLLEEAIKSCLSQTYKNFELVIVDDFSPEDLKSIVAPFLSDERVRYYRNEKNFGAVDVVDNWNRALSFCLVP